MMKIETDSEEERAGGSSNIQSKYGGVRADFVDLFDFFVSAYQHTANYGARTVASSETSAGQRRDSRQGLDF